MTPSPSFEGTLAALRRRLSDAEDACRQARDLIDHLAERIARMERKKERE